MQSAEERRRWVAQRTFVEYGADRLMALGRALGLGDESHARVELFRRLLDPWGRAVIGARPRYPSEISNDHAPFELAVAFRRGAPEMQVYIEAQGAPPTLHSNMEAGRALTDLLAAERGVSLSRLRQIEDLFFPESPRGTFAVWLGITWAHDGNPAFKVYLNPRIRGIEAAGELVGEAMSRLGFSTAWARANDPSVPGAPEGHEIAIFCLDLSAGDAARVKVYRRHRNATAEQIEAAASVARDYQAGDATALCAFLGGSGGPFLSKPLITSLTFRPGDADRPSSVTLEFPLAEYSANDGVAGERVRRYLAYHGLPTAPYDRVLAEYAMRPLDERAGMHAHVTLRRESNAPRVTVYLTSEAYAVA